MRPPGSGVGIVAACSMWFLPNRDEGSVVGVEVVRVELVQDRHEPGTAVQPALQRDGCHPEALGGLARVPRGGERDDAQRRLLELRERGDALQDGLPCLARDPEAPRAERRGGLVQGLLEQAVGLRGPRSEWGDLERTTEQVSDAV